VQNADACCIERGRYAYQFVRKELGAKPQQLALFRELSIGRLRYDVPAGRQALEQERHDVVLLRERESSLPIHAALDRRANIGALTIVERAACARDN